jgi:predicted permease
VIPIAQAMAPQVKTALAIISAVVLLVLLLACANLAALLLARASGRAREIALRASLGAGRLRLVRQMLTESVLLALAGGCLGILITVWLMDVMRRAAHADFAFDTILRLDAPVFAFTLAVSLLTGVVFGLAPAIYASRTDLNAALKGGVNVGLGARSRSRFLSALVAGQVALSVVLLAGAGLLEKDFLYLLRLDTGVRTENVLTFMIELPRRIYTAQRATAFWSELMEKLQAVPGVRAASTVGSLPMSGNFSGGPFEIAGRPKPTDWMQMSTQYNDSMPGYFHTMGIPLLRGRDFDARDAPGSIPAVIINDFIARRYFSNEDPIGRRVRIGNGEWRTIVGVVGSTKHAAFSPRPEAQMYFAEAQSPDRAMSVVVRTAGDPTKLAGTAREIVRALDPALPVLRMRTMEEVVLDSLSQQSLMASFMAGFAAFALLLAALGIYGVIAYFVSQRTQEIGVRMALGATCRDVMSLVVRRGALLASAGVAAGMPAALWAARVMRSLLYGVSPSDLTVFVGVAALMLLIAMVASYIPARRAARVDPLLALRQE